MLHFLPHVFTLRSDTGTFSELFLLHDLHFCDYLLYYTPFAPSTGRGAENQVQQNLKNLQIKIWQNWIWCYIKPCAAKRRWSLSSRLKQVNSETQNSEWKKNKKIFQISLEKSESCDMLRTRCSAPEGDEAIEIQRIAKSGVPWKIE